MGERIQREREKVDCPTDPFTILETQNPGIVELYIVRNCRSSDLKALELRKSRLGIGLKRERTSLLG